MTRLRFSLTLTGLIDALDPFIFRASMVDHGKPAPDLFLFAAHKMGVLPQNCIVIENRPAGIHGRQGCGDASSGSSAALTPSLWAYETRLQILLQTSSSQKWSNCPLACTQWPNPGGAMPAFRRAVDVGARSARTGVFDLQGQSFKSYARCIGAIALSRLSFSRKRSGPDGRSCPFRFSARSSDR